MIVIQEMFINRPKVYQRQYTDNSDQDATFELIDLNISNYCDKCQHNKRYRTPCICGQHMLTIRNNRINQPVRHLCIDTTSVRTRQRREDSIYQTQTRSDTSGDAYLFEGHLAVYDLFESQHSHDCHRSCGHD